jgi:hypothetical protein
MTFNMTPPLIFPMVRTACSFLIFFASGGQGGFFKQLKPRAQGRTQNLKVIPGGAR